MTPKELAISVATQAGKILKENIGTITADDVEDKRPFDYVTEIDKACEQLIIKSIKKHFPAHEILAEESGKTKHKNAYCWIIDPLDGTTNFIHGNPHSAVSIALQKDNEIILGVTYDPYRDELYYAEIGKGAYGNNKRVYVSRQANINNCLIATGFPFKSRSFLDQYWRVLSEIFMNVSGIRRTGSAALDLAYVACGRFDGFWELKLSPWDVAAGALIIEEAGGKITDFEGEDNHIWTGDVVASNGIIHDFMMSKVQNVFRSNP
ncbi:MAG: inositol monophosphatase [bacterium]|nr:MAG: inositol monophosphatase [bacterium]